MKWRSIIFPVCFLVGIVWASCPAHATELNGFIFSDDSAHLYLNPFFSWTDRDVDFSSDLYGYGNFSGHDVSQSFRQYFTTGGVSCSVIVELGGFPTYTQAGVLRMISFTAYYHYAKDIDDNIHILRYDFFSDEMDFSWDYTDLPEGNTTLRYPAAPEAGREVFCGRISGTNVRVGEKRGCMTITYDSLFPAQDRIVTEYLAPEEGLIAASYNRDGRTNGFSKDGRPPEKAEKNESTWEEWTDEHCFISVCTPGKAHRRGWAARIPDLAAEARALTRNALTSIMNT